MPVVVIATTPDMTSDQYDQTMSSHDLGGRLPDGCTAHIAGPSPEGWRVISIWDSPEQAAEFGRTVLAPKLAQVGLTPTPPIVYPAHNVVL